jgi:hypothetical protein
MSHNDIDTLDFYAYEWPLTHDEPLRCTRYASS